MVTEVKRQILHLDLDAFFVAVEQRRHPALKDRPVIIGGDERRGVVASCSYEARKYGVHSAMPLYKARQLCPQAVVVPCDGKAYAEASEEVTQIMREEVPVLEKASVDEFYCDLTGMERFFGCVRHAQKLRDRIINETGLPVSGGLASGKTFAKMATDEAKPNGFMEVPYGKERDFLRDKPVQKIPMVGEVTARMLNDMGIKTAGDLMNLPEEVVREALGKNGLKLWEKANGHDPSPVLPGRRRRSLSAEQTFSTNVSDPATLNKCLLRLTEKIATRLRQMEWVGSVITLKLRYSDFRTVSRQCSVPPTNLDQELLGHLRKLLEKLYTRRMQLRLVGVTIGGLQPAGYQLDILNDRMQAAALAEKMDQMRRRFGFNVVGWAGARSSDTSGEEED